VISPSVREFLSSELKIRVEVPALELLPDGGMLGGCVPGGKGDVDVLQAHAHLADTDPNVVLGPDSVGTLSQAGVQVFPRASREGTIVSRISFRGWAKDLVLETIPSSRCSAVSLMIQYNAIVSI
jgi:hypothetical protein